MSQIRQALLVLYGQVNAFRLIDTVEAQAHLDAIGQLKAAKETGKQIADGLLQLISMTPKVKHMGVEQFELLIKLIYEYHQISQAIGADSDSTDDLWRLQRIYAAAAANIWV